jgi:hypothetical protein
MADAGAGQAVKQGGKGKTIAAIVAILIIVIVAIVLLALYGKDLFGGGGQRTIGPSTTQQQQPLTGGEGMRVGTLGATATVSEAGATQGLIEGAFGAGKGNSVAYLFCEQLDSGDTVSGSEDYQVVGPVYLGYVDDDPRAFFEHDVRYLFIDASTGEVTEVSESWPPEINGKEIFEAEEDCDEPMTRIYST